MDIQEWVSFHCYYPDGSHTEHRQKLSIADIPRWIESYKFTHPYCVAITVKAWFKEGAQ